MGRTRRGTVARQQSARNASRARGWDWRLPGFLAAVFAIKVVVVSQLQDHPLLAPDAGLDTASYVQLARRVLDGDLALGPGLYYLSPLYIYFLAATLTVSDSFVFARTVQVALGTAAVGFVFATARIWFGARAGWIAATLAALTGVFTFYEIVLLQSSLDAVLTAGGLYFLSRGLSARDGVAREPRWAAHEPPLQVIVAGVLFGLQVLNRPNVAIAIGGVVVVLLVLRRWRAAVLITAGLLAALAPIVVRNALVSRQFAIASSQGGLNFYIGNNPSATGQYVAVPGVRASIEGQSEDTRRVAEAATGRPLSDREISGYFTGLAADWIRNHPAAAATLFAKKMALVFNARHQWLDFSYPYYEHDAGTILRFLFVGPWLLVPLGLAGLVVAWPRGRPEYSAYAAFVPFYAIGVAIFFVAERYRLPMFVPLCVAAGGAIAWVVDAFRKRASVAVMAVMVLVGGVLTSWRVDVSDGRFDERLRLAKVLMNQRNYGAAAMELQVAHDLNPSHTVAEFNLGMALVSSGRGAEGIAHLRRAVDAGVPQKGARYAMVGAMLATGDRDSAVALLRTYSPGPEDDAESCYRVGLLAMDAGAPVAAARFLRRAVELRPGWPEPRAALDRITAGG